ncbi:hypothetical protein U3516DRAFT_661216 [Neocallimastix sp. 'constans']
MYNYNIINDRDQYMDYVQDNCVLKIPNIHLKNNEDKSSFDLAKEFEGENKKKKKKFIYIDYIDMNGQSVILVLFEKMYNYNKETNQVQYMDYTRVMSTFVNYQCDFNCY